MQGGQGRQQPFHHLVPPHLLGQLCQGLTRSSTEKHYRQLEGHPGDLHRQFPVHIHASWQPLAPKGLLEKVERVPPRLHLTLLTKVPRDTQRG
jgi:hypothetical protein